MASSQSKAFVASSSSDEDERTCDLPRYQQLELNSALQGQHRVRALEELAAVLLRIYPSRATKATQAAIFQDVLQAVQVVDRTQRGQTRAIALLKAVEKSLPQAKRAQVLAAHKKAALDFHRANKKAAAVRGGEPFAADDDDSDQEPSAGGTAGCSDVPPEVLEHIFQHLDPLSLAMANAVCREWRALSSSDALWGAWCQRLFPRARAPAAQQKARFAGLVAAQPRALLPWRSGRVRCCNRVAWVTEGRFLTVVAGRPVATAMRYGMRTCNHAFVDEVLDWLLRPTSKRCPTRSDDDDDDEDTGPSDRRRGSSSDECEVVEAQGDCDGPTSPLLMLRSWKLWEYCRQRSS